jgi:4-aminobutyrate---pyruvate transaminase
VGALIDQFVQNRGLILRVIGDRVVFTPPLIIDEVEIDEMLRRFRGALDDTWSDLNRAAA